MTVTTMENIPENERVRMAYLLGDNGLNAIAKTSFQAAVVDMVADNVVVVDTAWPRPSRSGKLEIYCQFKADNVNRTGLNSEPIEPYANYCVISG